MLHPQKEYYMLKNYSEDQNKRCFAAMRFSIILVLAVFKVQGGEARYQEVPQDDKDYRLFVHVDDDSSAPKFHPRNLEPIRFYQPLPSIGGFRDGPIPNGISSLFYAGSVPAPSVETYATAVGPTSAASSALKDVINVGVDIVFLPLAKLVSKFSAPAGLVVNYVHGIAKNSGYSFFEKARDVIENAIKSVVSAILGDGVTAALFPTVVSFLRGALETVAGLILPHLNTLKSWIS